MIGTHRGVELDTSASLAGDAQVSQQLLARAGATMAETIDDFEETRYYVLVLSSLYGACLIVSSDSFPTLFLGLEIMSLPVYVPAKGE